jgi:hypothetical protein
MGTIDIIPDIHGRIAKLRAALDALGWRRRPAGWMHPDLERIIVFLGDFIDRGPENRAVIHLVRDLIDRGVALPGLYPMNEDTKARYKAWTETR